MVPVLEPRERRHGAFPELRGWHSLAVANGRRSARWSGFRNTEGDGRDVRVNQFFGSALPGLCGPEVTSSLFGPPCLELAAARGSNGSSCTVPSVIRVVLMPVSGSKWIDWIADSGSFLGWLRPGRDLRARRCGGLFGRSDRSGRLRPRGHLMRFPGMLRLRARDETGNGFLARLAGDPHPLGRGDPVACL